MQEIYTELLKIESERTATDLRNDLISERKDNSEKPPEDRIPKFSFSKQLIPSLTQVNFIIIIVENINTIQFN